MQEEDIGVDLRILGLQSLDSFHYRVCLEVEVVDLLGLQNLDLQILLDLGVGPGVDLRILPGLWVGLGVDLQNLQDLEGGPHQSLEVRMGILQSLVESLDRGTMAETRQGIHPVHPIVVEGLWVAGVAGVAGVVWAVEVLVDLGNKVHNYCPRPYGPLWHWAQYKSLWYQVPNWVDFWASLQVSCNIHNFGMVYTFQIPLW